MASISQYVNQPNQLDDKPYRVAATLSLAHFPVVRGAGIFFVLPACGGKCRRAWAGKLDGWGSWQCLPPQRNRLRLLEEEFPTLERVRSCRWVCVRERRTRFSGKGEIDGFLIRLHLSSPIQSIMFHWWEDTNTNVHFEEKRIIPMIYDLFDHSQFWTLLAYVSGTLMAMIWWLKFPWKDYRYTFRILLGDWLVWD